MIALLLFLAASALAFAGEDPVPLLFDPETHSEGAAILNRMPSSRADKLVLNTLFRIRDDAEGRRILLRALAGAGRAGRRILGKVAAGSDEAMAEDVYRILARREMLDSIRSDMMRRLRDGRPTSLALLAVDYMVDLGDRTVTPSLERLVRDAGQDMDLRVRAALALGRLGGPEVIRFLTLVFQRAKVEGATSASLPLRQAVLDALAVRGGQDVIPTLIDALRVPELWSTAVSALVRMGSNAIPSLRLVMETGDPEVEAGVLAVLFRLGGIDVGRFVAMLSSADPKIRAKARWILLSFPDRAVAAQLLQRWRKPRGYPTRAEILDLLVPFYGDPKVREVFVQAVQTGNFALRKRALEVITGMRDLSMADEILTVAEDDRRPEIRVRAIRALVFLGIVKGRVLLERMLQFEDLPVRKEAAWALGWIGSAGTTPVALRATRDYRNAELWPRVIHADARLTRAPLMEGAEPHHYGTIPPFRADEAADAVDASTQEITFRGEPLEIISFGSGKPLLVFSPLPGSDPASVFAALGQTSRLRRVIFFRLARPPGPAPHRINAPMRDFMIAAAQAVLVELGTDDPVDVMGWSLGATWATTFCLDRPARCRRLILASPMSMDPEFWRTVPTILRASLPPWLASDLDFLEVRRDHFADAAWGRYYGRLLSVLYVAQAKHAVPLMEVDYPFFLRMPEAPFLRLRDALRVLGRGGVPIVALFGQHDLLGGDWYDAISSLRKVPSQVFTIPDAGHLALFENPSAVSPFLVRVLRRD